ncbi:MAG: DnaJ domain-containing protein, partial [Planctomycetota bacterium]
MSPASEKRDYYEVLGVPKNADAEAIKRAYRKVALRHHPDKNPGNKEAEERFKEAAEAYEILADPEKRAAYDRFGHAGVGGQARHFDSFQDVFSAFGDIFGGGSMFDELFGRIGGRGRGRREARAQGAHLKVDLEVTLEEVRTGTKKSIVIQRNETCAECRGSGARAGSSPRPCPECGGRGQVQRERTLSVKIPPGVDTGTRLRLAGEGEAGEESAP